jgi:hypothetical protein
VNQQTEQEKREREDVPEQIVERIVKETEVRRERT